MPYPLPPAMSLMLSCVPKCLFQTSAKASLVNRRQTHGRVPSPSSAMQPPVCYQFTQRGFCSYGSNCRFLHAAVGASWGHGADARSGQGQPPGRRAPTHVFQQQQASFYFRSETQVLVSAAAGYRGSHGSTAPSHERSWTSAGGGQDGQTIKNDRINREGGSRALDFRLMSWNILAAELVSTECHVYPDSLRSCPCRVVWAWVGQVVRRRVGEVCEGRGVRGGRSAKGP